MNRLTLIALLAGVQRFALIGVNYWFFTDEFVVIASVVVAFVFASSLVLRRLCRRIEPNVTFGFVFFLIIILFDGLVPLVLFAWILTRGEPGLILSLVTVVSIFLINPHHLFRRPRSIFPGQVDA